MTVRELMELLRGADPDATVRLMNQENWPFEYGIAGVAIREDFYDGTDADAEPLDEGTDTRDVFILEGRQERYGDTRAWEVTR